MPRVASCYFFHQNSMANNGSSSPTWPAFTVYPCCIEDPEQYIIRCENRSSTACFYFQSCTDMTLCLNNWPCQSQKYQDCLYINYLLEYPSPYIYISYITHIYICMYSTHQASIPLINAQHHGHTPVKYDFKTS